HQRRDRMHGQAHDESDDGQDCQQQKEPEDRHRYSFLQQKPSETLTLSEPKVKVQGLSTPACRVVQRFLHTPGPDQGPTKTPYSGRVNQPRIARFERARADRGGNAVDAAASRPLAELEVGRLTECRDAHYASSTLIQPR